MPDGTTYDVVIRMMMRDEAQAKVNALGGELDKTTRKAKETRSALEGLGTLAAAAFGAIGIQKAYEGLIGFNAQVQSIQTGLAAVVRINFGGSFETAERKSRDMFEEFQRFAKVSPTTTAEVAQFGQIISSAAFSTGASMQEFMTMSEQAVIAARVFGVETHTAQIQMQELLLGNVKTTQIFSQQLIRAGHMTMEQFRELDDAGRKNFILKVLTSPAMMDAGKKMAVGWAGATTTLIDNIQIFIGKVGSGLFKKLTDEILKWNALIEHNAVAIEKWGNEFADGMVKAFNFIKDAISFVVDHREALMGLAMAWQMATLGGRGAAGGKAGAGMEIAFMTGAVGKGIGRGAMGIAAGEMMGMGHLESAGMGVMAGLSALPGPLGWVAAGATAAALGLHAVAENAERAIESDAARRARIEGISDLTRKLAEGRVEDRQRYLSDVGRRAVENQFISAQGVANQAEVLKALGFTPEKPDAAAKEFGDAAVKAEADRYRMLTGGMTGEEARRALGGNVHGRTPEEETALQTLAGVIVSAMDIQLAAQRKAAEKFNTELNDIFERNQAFAYASGWQGPFPADPSVAAKPTVNVTIQHIDVQADDPDRFVFGLVEIARVAYKQQGASKHTLPEP